ncbi:MAG: hypothetical protein P8K08_15355 [Fuerstiella sp.]|jgi:hypothetical protein|nr:hypothetical protein [Fuerstiella sp.]
MSDPNARDKARNEANTTMYAAEHRANRVFALLIVAEALLILATWPLWTAVDLFPAVPLFSQLGSVPVIIDQLTLAVLLASTVAYLWSRRTRPDGAAVSAPVNVPQSNFRRNSLLLMTASACWLVALNQHRLQSWHWLFILVTAQSIVLVGWQRLWGLRLTFAVIYVFAALSRLGPDVGTGMSRQLLQTACALVGVEQPERNEQLFFSVCLAMTLVELAVGLCLMLPRTRLAAVAVAMTLHGLLLLLLSPIGLNHQSGVLIWNVLFIVAIPLLFTGPRLPDSNTSLASGQLRLTAAVIVLIPLSGLFGIADNWPSWQLYSPRPDVVRLYVDEASVADLPQHVQQFVGTPAPLGTMCPVRLDRWSLATTGAPIYPEARFQLVVVRNLLLHVPAAAVRITVESADSPLWWHRTTRELDRAGPDRLAEHQFLLNRKFARY